MSEKKHHNHNSVQSFFYENYNVELALSLSKTDLEAKKQLTMASQNFENILPPLDAFEIIKDRLNLFYS